MPKFALIAGVIAGGVMAIGGTLEIVDTILGGRSVERIFSSVLSLICGALLAAYFVWLIRLKAKLAVAAAAEQGSR